MFKKVVPFSLAFLFAATAPLQVSAEDTSPAEVLKKSNEAMLELDSYSSVTKMEQTMTVAGEEVMFMTEAEQDITLDPFAMHQTSTTSGMGQEDVTLESYWTEDGFFQEDPEQGWIKMPEELSESMDEMIGMAMAGDQVAQAEELAEDMSVEDKEDSYLLTFDGDGEDLMEASMGMMESNMSGEQGSMMEEMMNQITINEVSYEMTIDKESHYMTHLMMDMDMEMEMEGESSTTSQSMDMTIDNFNGVDTITVPEDIVNGATPLEDNMMEEEMPEEEMSEEGGELPDTATNQPMIILAGLSLAGLGGFLVFRRRPQHQ
ncbi:LPXTG cell wall anchor domain-containing protein [Halobacillus campisalis]|uniref:DUF6612 family protein n=1 Tax=Halobacillus campisalis TaxID=435909 RepID=A0ABW2K7Z6_9BACI|nr:LPXTG cell wall anchor domain-containing protein [Halobacillus campisalis]